MWWAYLFIGICFYASPRGATLICDDIDTNACQLMFEKRPDMCNDTSISSVTCPRLCNKCSLECYHCNATLAHITDCTTTTSCNAGELCMIMARKSSSDGHSEYQMTCKPALDCDGTNHTFQLIGKRDRQSRDVTVKCCGTDLCNYPAGEPYIVTSPKPASHPSPTSHPDCRKDVILLVDESTSMSHNRHDVLKFLALVVGNLNVSRHGTHVSMATYSSTVRNKFDLDRFYNVTEVQTAIKSVHFHGGKSDTNAALTYLLHSATSTRAGDRAHVPDTVVFVTNTVTSSSGIQSKEHMMQHTIPNIIVLGIGHHLGQQALQQLATSSGHGVKVENTNKLDGHRDQLVRLICKTK